MARQSRFVPNLIKASLQVGLAVSCVQALVCDGKAQTIHWPKQDLVIPLQISSAGPPPFSLELEVSEDAGGTWHSASKVDSKQRQFQFQTKRDGEFWFRVKSFDRNGQLIDQPGEAMRIAVDSTKPTGELLIDLDRKGDMVAEFRIIDTALDYASVRLEYQTDLDTAWKEIPCKTEKGTQAHEWLGTATWQIPHQATQLMVRLSGRDHAGNLLEVTRMPKLPRTAAANGNMKFASARQPGHGTTLPADAVPPPNLVGSGLKLAPAAPNTAAPPQVQPAPTAPASKSLPQNLAPPRVITSSTGLPLRSLDDQPIPPSSNATPSGANKSSLIVNNNLPGNNATGSSMDVVELPRLEPPLMTKSLGQPNALHSSSKSFELDYSIVNDPGAPISSVELWGTLDQGKTWERWGVDADRESPFDIEVETEGLFGFKMVIVGSNGLASRRPLPGDAADSWIEVDTTVPRVRILSALAGKGTDAGALVIEYQAIDEHFIERPINLFYSETLLGPWTPITQGAKNQGRFAWSGDIHVPEKVYLKIQAIDAAGNIGEHVLDLPVDVQSAAPRGKIQGFRPR